MEDLDELYTGLKDDTTTSKTLKIANDFQQLAEEAKSHADRLRSRLEALQEEKAAAERIAEISRTEVEQLRREKEETEDQLQTVLALREAQVESLITDMFEKPRQQLTESIHKQHSRSTLLALAATVLAMAISLVVSAYIGTKSTSDLDIVLQDHLSEFRELLSKTGATQVADIGALREELEEHVTATVESDSSRLLRELRNDQKLHVDFQAMLVDRFELFEKSAEETDVDTQTRLNEMNEKHKAALDAARQSNVELQADIEKLSGLLVSQTESLGVGATERREILSQLEGIQSQLERQSPTSVGQDGSQ